MTLSHRHVSLRLNRSLSICVSQYHTICLACFVFVGCRVYVSSNWGIEHHSLSFHHVKDCIGLWMGHGL